MLAPSDDRERLYLAALASMVVLVAGILLYPDVYTNIDFTLGPLHARVSGILLVLTAPLIIIYIYRHRRDLKPGYIDIFILLTFFFIVVRGVLAARQIHETGLVIVVFACYALVLYYGMAVLGQRFLTMRTMFTLLVIIGLIVAGYAVIEFILFKNVIYGDLVRDNIPKVRNKYYRSGSTLGHPVALGLFLVQIAPLFILLYFGARTTARRITWGVAIILLSIALVVTFTKGAWGTAVILAFAAILLFLWRRPELRRPMLMILVAAAMALSLLILFYPNNLTSAIFSQSRVSGSIDGRLYMWSKSPQTFAENPIFGAGMMRGVDEIFLVEPQPDDLPVRPKAIDNIYLKMLVEEGLLGSLLAGATLILIASQAWKLIRGGGRAGTIALLLSFSMSAVLIDGMTFDSMMILPIMSLFWMGAGLLRAQIDLKCI